MNLRPLVRQLLAMLAAWGVVILATGLVDALFGTIVQLLTTAWLLLGIFVMRARRLDFPIPSPERFDIRGALGTLWWAAFWPRYLSRK